MSKKYEVIWSNIDEKDLMNIIEYIAVDSPPNALTNIKENKTEDFKPLSLPQTRSYRTRITRSWHFAIS